MATRAELEQARRALERIVRESTKTLAAIMASVSDADQAVVGKVLRTAYPELIAEFGRASGALAADVAEEWLSNLALRPQVAMGEPISAPRAVGLVNWSLGRPNPTNELVALTDKLVKQPWRDTMQQSAHASGAAWARVPMGDDPCAFCLMVAGRGAVYRTQETAEFDNTFHGGKCKCQVAIVRDESDFPEGYDPDGYFDIYSEARAMAEAETPPKQVVSTNLIISKMREVAGISH